jgi:hypothetical protein
MSHFTVMIVTDDRPSQERLGEILQPWHEFECTGTDDKYVQDLDRTEEALSDYRKATDVRLKAPDGTLHDRFDEKGNWKPEFSKEGEGVLARRVEFVPEGYERVDVPVSDHETAAEWIEGYFGWNPLRAGEERGADHKYGFIELNEAGDVVRCIDRTNPNKKWDWWVMGGRWSGMMKMNADVAPILGRPGAFDNEAPKGHGDMAMFGDVDLVGMRAAASEDAGRVWDRAREAAGSLPVPRLWDVVRDEIIAAGQPIDDARTIYHEQPAIKALRQAFPQQWDIDEEVKALTISRDDACAAGASRALSTFAIVKDGEWHERGSMGWWGAVSGEMPESDWNKRVAELLDGLPATSWLTIVDCHI